MSAPSTPQSLLLVDDDPSFLFLTQDYLRLEGGYQVTTAPHGQAALHTLTQPTAVLPDLIICDVMMPGLDGYELVRRLRALPATRLIPVIFLSAKGATQDRIEGLNAGGDVYLVKPFEPEELLAQVRSSLAQAERLRQQSLGAPLIQVPEDIHLTPTERRVIGLVARGYSNREVAEALQVSQRTVESHVSNMLGKTGLHNRTELARWAMESRLGT